MNRLHMFLVLELYCICNVLGKIYLIEILANVTASITLEKQQE